MTTAFFIIATGTLMALVGGLTWTITKIAGIDSEVAEIGGVTAMGIGALCLIIGLALMGIEEMA